MAIPLIPLVAGAALGGIATYFYKDPAARKKVTDSFKGAGNKVTESVENVKNKFTKKSSSEISEDGIISDELKMASEEFQNSQLDVNKAEKDSSSSELK